MDSQDPHFQETVIYLLVISVSLLLLVITEIVDRCKKMERAQKLVDFTLV